MDLKRKSIHHMMLYYLSAGEKKVYRTNVVDDPIAIDCLQCGCKKCLHGEIEQ